MKKYTAWLLVLVLLVTFPTVALGSLFDMTLEEMQASMIHNYKALYRADALGPGDEDAIHLIFPFKDDTDPEKKDNIAIYTAQRADRLFSLMILSDSATGKMSNAFITLLSTSKDDTAVHEAVGMFLASFCLLYATEDNKAPLDKGVALYQFLNDQAVGDEVVEKTEGAYQLRYSKLGGLGYMLAVSPAEEAGGAANTSGL